MAVQLILCRLKEDHTTTAMLGKSALFHFPDWEPVPEQEPEAAPAVKTEETAKPAPSKTGKAAPSAASKE